LDMGADPNVAPAWAAKADQGNVPGVRDVEVDPSAGVTELRATSPAPGDRNRGRRPWQSGRGNSCQRSGARDPAVAEGGGAKTRGTRVLGRGEHCGEPRDRLGRHIELTPPERNVVRDRRKLAWFGSEVEAHRFHLIPPRNHRRQ